VPHPQPFPQLVVAGRPATDQPSLLHDNIRGPGYYHAILDRVIHRSHRIELKGESLRKRQSLAATVRGLSL
jgi:hypothetical protein